MQELPRVSQYPPPDGVGQEGSPEGTEPDALDGSSGTLQQVKGQGGQQPGPSTFPLAHSPPNLPDTVIVDWPEERDMKRM